jgi:two-component system chemotaxis response regulator CheY
MAAAPAAALLVPALTEPVIAIARQLAGIELAPSDGSCGPDWRQVIFQDGGAWRARLVLALDERLERCLRLELYASLGLTLEPGEEDAALAELGNCIMGHIDGRLAGLGLNLEFSVPAIAGGADVPGEGEVQAAAAVLGSAAGTMGITLYLRSTTGRHEDMTAKPYTCLIVDDSSPMRRALRGILERAGFVIAGEATNGIEAIKLYRELLPDLVTMDIVMPQMDGVQTLRAIHEFHPAARVVMVTAMTSMNKVQECARFGANHYIVKPFDEEKVKEVLDRVVAAGDGAERPGACG